MFRTVPHIECFWRLDFLRVHNCTNGIHIKFRSRLTPPHWRSDKLQKKKSNVPHLEAIALCVPTQLERTFLCSFGLALLIPKVVFDRKSHLELSETLRSPWVTSLATYVVDFGVFLLMQQVL